MKRKIQLVLLVVSSLFFASGCASLGRALGDEEMVKASQDMTPKQEYYLGRSISAQILTENKVLGGESLNKYLNTLGQYLVLHSEGEGSFKGFRFAVIQSDIPTALSAPGGYIFVSSGLVKELNDEDELAAVLSHEIAHIELKHANQAIKTKNKMATATKWGAAILELATGGDVTSDMGETFGSAVSEVVNIKYNKNQEVDADIRGMFLMGRAGYDPAALLHFIKRLKTSAGLLSKHPRSEARVQKINEALKTFSWSGNKEKRTRRFSRWKKQVVKKG